MDFEKLGSLRIRLMALVLFALAPALAFIIFASLERGDELAGEFRDDARNLAAMASASGRAPLADAKNLLDSLSGFPEVGRIDADACRELFSSLLRISAAFANIGLVAPDGELICAGAAPTSRVNYADREWFLRAVAGGGFTVSGYVVSRASGKPVIVLARPIMDGDGALSAVLYVAVSLDWFHVLIDGIKLPAGTTISVIDRRGEILARRPEQAGLLGQTIPNGEQVMGEVLSGDMDINEEWGIDGVKRLYAFAPILAFPGNELYMRVGIPLELAQARVRWAMWRALSFLVLAAAAILAGTHFFSEAVILRPVRRLVAAAGSLERGEQAGPGGLADGSGEFADLGRAFERMAVALREKMRFTQMLIDSIPAPIFYKDRAGLFYGCNVKFVQDILPRETIIGKSVYELFAPENAAQYAAMDRELVANPPTQIYETEMPFGDGSSRHVRIYKALTRDGDGRPSGIVGVIMDITERKNLEESLTRAKEAAEAANEVKTRFLASVSHEIRTPMNSIMGMTELLLHGELSRAQRDFLEAVEESSKTLLTLIDGILDFAKIEAGELGLEHIDYDPRRLVRDALRPLRTQAAAKGVGLVVDIDPGLPAALRGDPVRLRQILVNLAGNAVKFTERGGVAVHVGLADSDGSAKEVVFRVTDSGIGIPADKIEEIFEPFRQADGSVARRYGGTGLGLAISRELAVLMGGEIRVASEPGQGSVFTFSTRFEPGDPGRVAPAPGDRRQAASPPSRRLRVLVVDDNEINLKVGQALLVRLGHDPRTAAGGEAAIEMLAAERFDVVFMDLEMPGMDGFAVTREIRAGAAGEEASRVPIIAVTAHALAGYRDRCKRAGMEDFVTKPVSLGALEACLAFLSGGRQSGQSGQFGQSDPSGEPGQDPAGSALLDEEGALSRLGGDRELLRDLTERFAADAPAKLQRIREAVGRRDYDSAVQEAHALRGICGAVGAVSAMQAADRLENAAKDRAGNLDDLCAELTAGMDAVLARLNLMSA